MSCTACKDTPLTHGHVVTIIAKALNINLDNYTRIVVCTYFTNHDFVRGEVVDVAFQFIPACSRSCWRGIVALTLVEEPHTSYQLESDPEEELPQYPPFRDVPMITYPLQSPPGSSSYQPLIWDQILNNLIAMQRQLNEMESQNQ